MDRAAEHSVRRATAADLATLGSLRERMLREMGADDEEHLARIAAAFEQWAGPTMAAGELAGFIAEEAGLPIGGLMAVLVRMPPGYHVVDGRHAYLLGMFVEPARRRRGVASALVRAACDWAEAEGFGIVTLNASDAGRPLYESLGFEDSSQMRRYTEHAFGVERED